MAGIGLVPSGRCCHWRAAQDQGKAFAGSTKGKEVRDLTTWGFLRPLQPVTPADAPKSGLHGNQGPAGVNLLISACAHRTCWNSS